MILEICLYRLYTWKWFCSISCVTSVTAAPTTTKFSIQIYYYFADLTQIYQLSMVWDRQVCGSFSQNTVEQPNPKTSTFLHQIAYFLDRLSGNAHTIKWYLSTHIIDWNYPITSLIVILKNNFELSFDLDQSQSVTCAPVPGEYGTPVKSQLNQPYFH